MEIWLGWSDVSCYITDVYIANYNTLTQSSKQQCDDEEDDGGKDHVILAILSMRCKIKHFDNIYVLFLSGIV